jgi:predicted RNA-binding Zn ribbon-like protein
MVDAALFAEARALRAALRELALANTLGSPPAASRRTAIDDALGRFPLAVGLVDGVPRLRPAGRGARGGLGAIAASVAEERAAGSWGRRKGSRHGTCGGGLFDGSRNRSSSWCSMQVCGGRAKASSYRSRRAAKGAR